MSSRSTASPAHLPIRGTPITIKMAVALGVVLLIAGLLGAQFARSMLVDMQQRMIYSEQESLSRAQALHVVDSMENEIAALDRLRTDSTIRARLEATADVVHEPEAVYLNDALVTKHLEDYMGIYPEFAAMAVIGNDGHVLASIPALPEESVSEPGSWYWYRAVADRGWRSTYVSGPQSDGLTGVRGTHIALPIFAPDNSDAIIGVLYAVWDMSNLQLSSKTQQQEYLVLEYDGTLVAGPDGVGSLLPEALRDRMRQQTSGAFSAPEGASEFDGWVYGYTRFSDLGLQFTTLFGVEWIVVARKPLAVLANDVSQLTRQLYLVFGFSSILITAVISGVLVLFLQPLHRLTEAAESIRAGDLTTEIPLSPPDEVGTLADVLRSLVVELVRRVNQLDAANRVSQVTGRFLAMDDLLNNAARSIALEFHYPGVVIYLLTAGGHSAVLRASRGRLGGEVGSVMEVNANSVVGRAVILGEPQVDSGEEPCVALPLSATGRTLGALLIKTTADKPIDQQTIGLLMLVSDQLSTSIHNVQLFEESIENLAEIEALNQRLTHQAWEDLFGRDARLRYTLDPTANWPEKSVVTLSHGMVVAEAYTDSDGREVLAAPLVLRGATIGSLSVARPPGSRWTRDEHLLLEAVAMRLVTIAEGIRLVEETSWHAELEQRVNDVSANLLQRAASVDDVLRTALEQFSQTLGSQRVALRLGTPPADSVPPRNGAHGQNGGHGDSDDGI